MVEMHGTQNRTIPIDKIRQRQIRDAQRQQAAEPLSVGEILSRMNHLQLPTSLLALPSDRRSIALLQRANIPQRHQNAIGQIRDRGDAWISMRDALCESAGQGYLTALLGKRGTGKTQAACHAIVHRTKLGQPALYVKAMEIFLVIRAAMRMEAETELDALGHFTSPSLLVIDEVGERAETAFEDRMLVYLLDKRYDARQDTILIANLKQEAFRESMGPSVWDRLCETGGVVECNWDSFRGRPIRHEDAASPNHVQRVPPASGSRKEVRSGISRT